MDGYKLVFLAQDVRDVHVVGGGAKIFKLLASEDINCNEMDLRVTVLAGFGSAHFDNLAGATLDDDESVLAERRALHRIGGGSTSIGALEGVLMLSGKLVSRIWGNKLNGLIRRSGGRVRGLRRRLPGRRPP